MMLTQALHHPRQNCLPLAPHPSDGLLGLPPLITSRLCYLTSELQSFICLIVCSMIYDSVHYLRVKYLSLSGTSSFFRNKYSRICRMMYKVFGIIQKDNRPAMPGIFEHSRYENYGHNKGYNLSNCHYRTKSHVFDCILCLICEKSNDLII